MNQDFVDLLRAFAAADVRFLIVGAYGENAEFKRGDYSYLSATIGSRRDTHRAGS